MDNRLYNTLRYAISFIAVCLCWRNPIVLALVAVALLLLNNFLDDVVFYVGNRYVGKKIAGKGGIVSPVNGVVTVVENGVPLFSGIKKVNPVTHNELMSLDMAEGNDRKVFNHVAIFLNKFNHHVVINPADCKEMYAHRVSGNLEMVGLDELVGHNGEYLDNDAIVFKYDSCYVVVTMDKYVSRYLLGSKEAMSPSMIIMKGSQCDIYCPERRRVCKKVGDIVQAGETVVSSFRYYSKPDKQIYTPLVKELVSEAIYIEGGVLRMFSNNVRKTASTFKNPVIAVSCLVGMASYILSPAVSYVAFSSILLFVFVRWYRHTMYCIMNYVGLKPWMEKSYSAISKLSIIWQRNPKNCR